MSWTSPVRRQEWRINGPLLTCPSALELPGGRKEGEKIVRGKLQCGKLVEPSQHAKFNEAGSDVPNGN